MPRISQKKMEAMKRRARSAGRRVVGGVRGSALQAAAGAVAYLGHYAVNSRVAVLQANWWATPAIMGVAGHVLKKRRKLSSIGDAMLGAAGYAMALGYSASRSAAAAAETGALVSPADTGAMYGEYDTGVAGYLDDSTNPTSAFYDDGSRYGSDVSEAMGL